MKYLCEEDYKTRKIIEKLQLKSNQITGISECVACHRCHFLRFAASVTDEQKTTEQVCNDPKDRRPKYSEERLRFFHPQISRVLDGNETRTSAVRDRRIKA